MPLKNNYSEDLELASLLVKIDVFPAKVTIAGAGGGRRAGYSLTRSQGGTDRSCTALVEAGERGPQSLQYVSAGAGLRYLRPAVSWPGPGRFL